ncbi:MAG: ATP-binding protein [Candidatus Scalindua sp. AMX11]|nr:MAG: ATP-binding protein [Candidatus Scalindua sp.]NOG82803.1 ATP-binding protein [Planctomycetota bacterium]RZV69031.1 MAG: ATP-binding protein [Candidatus Scalindua sp. SCAELEC01]TDE63862.1 MAG: ATP-binding protein [Candidatus Scalindua sp. AMX11]GJQ60424.1 MAG: hypothetical protein SCALA701_32250 [Candidatus Scalindua sp.]
MKTSEVFGVSNKQVASYIEREEVDTEFVKGLELNKHIIIFGASKQGKTALTNKHLQEDQFVRVNCAPQTTSIDIYKSILRQLDVEFEEERTERSSVETSAKALLKVKVKIPIFGSGEAGTEGEGKCEKENETKYTSIEYNLALPQDVSEILKAITFNKRIILENFHYLDEDIQKELAFHLRVFEDANILFIVLGIWREKNRLAQYNGDLQDRLIEIPVEPWTKVNFRKVAEIGENLLKVSLIQIIDDIILNSFDSIGVFQELCKESCLAGNVTETQIKEVHITEEHLDVAKTKKLDDYSGRHIRSIETFVEQRAKSSNEVPLYIAYYFIKHLFSLNFDSIQEGIKRPVLHEGIKSIHHRPNDVRASDISYFLHNIVATQVKKNIIPPLFDYDRSTRKLKIIDSTLYFFLRNANKDEVLEELDLPI